LKIGIVGLGVVGGTLYKWLAENNPKIQVVTYDPPLGFKDKKALSGSDAIFVSVPVSASHDGQDETILREAVTLAKECSPLVFIRSTVLPGTNDRLGTIAMPEFLTERHAYKDFSDHAVLAGRGPGGTYSVLRSLFPEKDIIQMENVECELAKFTHNCFGAMKVSYFNIIYELCNKTGASFDAVKYGAGLTGYIERTHTQVPGPDGQKGYGGKCFPENIKAMEGFLSTEGLAMPHARIFFEAIQLLNWNYREGRTPRAETPFPFEGKSNG
jgi:UDP-glucose 6-dehydrogenase